MSILKINVRFSYSKQHIIRKGNFVLGIESKLHKMNTFLCWDFFISLVYFILVSLQVIQMLSILGLVIATKISKIKVSHLLSEDKFSFSSLFFDLFVSVSLLMLMLCTQIKLKLKINCSLKYLSIP